MQAVPNKNVQPVGEIELHKIVNMDYKINVNNALVWSVNQQMFARNAKIVYKPQNAHVIDF